MSVKICCDFCDKPLVIDEEKLIFKTYTTKELNTKKMFPNLCENCASKIDQVLVFAKDEWLKQIDISDRNSKINAARRELLGTKG